MSALKNAVQHLSVPAPAHHRRAPVLGVARQASRLAARRRLLQSVASVRKFELLARLRPPLYAPRGELTVVLPARYPLNGHRRACRWTRPADSFRRLRGDQERRVPRRIARGAIRERVCALLRHAEPRGGVETAR